MDFSEQLQEISNHLNALVRRAASNENLSFAQAQLLLAIPSEGISMTNLADSLGIDISTLSRNVKKLEQLNLIYRERDGIDSRMFNIFLSHTGDDIVDLLYSHLDENNTQLLKTIPLETQKRIGDVLEQINWAFTQLREK
jgi:DNA-binding MarR family transcriptional regulator